MICNNCENDIVIDRDVTDSESYLFSTEMHCKVVLTYIVGN